MRYSYINQTIKAFPHIMIKGDQIVYTGQKDKWT